MTSLAVGGYPALLERGLVVPALGA
jgi:hypothetical protein